MVASALIKLLHSLLKTIVTGTLCPQKTVFIHADRKYLEFNASHTKRLDVKPYAHNVAHMYACGYKGYM